MAVQGLGFVGSVMSLVVANAVGEDYAVIGVDLDSDAGRRIVDSLNGGVFPVAASDPKILTYFKEARVNGNLLATVDPTAFSRADVIIVDVNLDVAKRNDERNALYDFDVDLGPFQAAIRTIGQHCKPNALVLVETTVPPGTCRHIVEPTLHEELLKRGLTTESIRIGHSYERVMPGPTYVDSIESFYRVYSGIDEASADATEAFLRTVIRTDEYPLSRLGNTNATEMAKVLENSYRAMNIAFVVDWSRMAEEAGVNLFEVVNAIRLRPTHANLMLPGIGVGGYCLTKDPLLASWSRSNLLSGDGHLPHCEQAVSINDQMPRYAFEFLERRYPEQLAGHSVLLLGVSYRGDVGDTRFSPVEPFFRCLAGAEASITAHDPYVREWPEVGLAPFTSLSQALEPSPDLVVISAGHTMYGQPDTISTLLECEPMWIYDTIGLMKPGQIEALKEKHKVIVLGRGDL
ncbi:MAG: nucleotide sugar dehydrogenase [Rhodospirillaceae bacterium]